MLNCALQYRYAADSSESSSIFCLYISHRALYPSAISRSSESSSVLASSVQYELMSLVAFLIAGILQGKNASTIRSICP